MHAVREPGSRGKLAAVPAVSFGEPAASRDATWSVWCIAYNTGAGRPCMHCGLWFCAASPVGVTAHILVCKLTLSAFGQLQGAASA